MGNIKYDLNKIICIILCVISLAGFVLPAIHINIDFVGNTRNTRLSAATIFNRDASLFGDSDFYSSSSESRFADTFRDSISDIFTDIFANVSTKAITSVGAYFITLILLILILIFTFISKFKKITNGMLVASFVLLAYAGNTILSIQEPLMETLYSGLGNALGLFALFINIPDLIKISFNLGNGYWLTIFAIGGVLLTKIILYIHSKYLSRKLTYQNA